MREMRAAVVVVVVLVVVGNVHGNGNGIVVASVNLDVLGRCTHPAD